MGALRQGKLKGAQTADFLHDFLTSFSAQCVPELAFCIKVSLCIPVTSAEAERVFSTMNRIKDESRASLGHRMLENLVLVSRHGPALQDYPFDRALYRWYKAGNHKETLSTRFLWEVESRLFPTAMDTSSSAEKS
jgi:hypothetical protein